MTMLNDTFVISRAEYGQGKYENFTFHREDTARMSYEIETENNDNIYICLLLKIDSVGNVHRLEMFKDGENT